jgi:ribosome-binding ATPase YchF (GTP1/OBG family)
MKTGIIGLPQVGKTSLFKILTKARLEERGHSRQEHIGVARVPDERLDKLSALYSPKKTTYASVEFVDVAAIGQEALKETAFLASLRQVDALIHVLRAFEEESIPHVGPIDPLRDIKNVEFDLMISDLTQVEKRLERLEKDLKKGRTSELEHEQALLLRSKKSLEKEIPLRELEMTNEEKKLIRGFMFLSQKPILYALNICESTTLGDDLEAAVSRFKLDEVAHRPNAGATAICGKVEAELAEMDDAEAAEFLGSYGLRESGLVRLIRKSYELLGLISFLHRRRGRVPGMDGAGGLEGAARLLGRFTPIWSTISFAPRPFAGMRNCWMPGLRRRRGPRARCAWKARSTWCRMGM